ncbi:hypothetical protein ATE48_00315 [Candidatus Viadribacter manganicus]|uniref:DUF4282 domain-containing protein n=1 Tax=Candidatus Viadribacter manganicus TaxID=1759059 RepID=A0A1B1AD41_9PROT|nr:hypothetical protein ATE48_00315 [Candidatus Viadribacter manganicus]
MNTVLRFVRVDWWQTLKLVLLIWGGLMAIGFGTFGWTIRDILTFLWLVPVFFVTILTLRFLTFLLLLKSQTGFERAYEMLSRRKTE